ncbi:DapH/DapD/GlmU-related protein [Bradyrhizobium sp. Ec3.3]|uniref:DapH/DapD/GlmU-related protein n=1 Tax=Bradyrhizobium sp. Ec3.3 TaxID=189753 RepID=UPI000A01E224
MRCFPEPTEVTIAHSARIGKGAILGVPHETRLTSREPTEEEGRFCNRVVRIGERTIIGPYVTIFEGVNIGDDVIIEQYSSIGADTRIGTRTRICYRAWICDSVEIEDDCVVGGFVCDEAFVGKGSRIFGNVVHEQSRPHLGWWEVNERAPKIRDHSFVGFGASVVGGISVGPSSYICAGALVTKDVPPLTVVKGINECVPASEWTGGRLQALVQSWRCP